mmetsp:Transcript_22644/g.56077  ORF Transcript_22644/g.56077 Transcript_22644/m.56077 type:complete len:86 (-) Transcript_22644:297-554(-)
MRTVRIGFLEPALKEGEDPVSENRFLSYPLEAMLANEKGALSDEEDGMDVTDPAEVPSNEGVVCHDDDRRGDMLPPKLIFIGDEP